MHYFEFSAAQFINRQIISGDFYSPADIQIIYVPSLRPLANGLLSIGILY